MNSKLLIAFLAAAVVVAMVGVVPVSGTTGSVATGDAARHGATTNFTVTVSDHTPGKQGTTMSAYAAGLQADFDVWGNLTVMLPAAQGSTCQISSARAAGVDENNDDPGTTTDKSFVGRYSENKKGNNDAGQNFTSYNFYAKDSFAGNSISLRSDDQIVARLANCWKNPDSPGWYRWNGYVNGTTPDGSYAETNAYSHWYYICDCQSYDQAVNTLGSPPTDAAGSESDDGSPGTIVTKNYNLNSAGSSSGSGGGSTATATSTSGSGGSTATATPTSGSGGSTATATSGGSAGTATQDGSTTSTGTGPGTSTDGGSTGTAAGTTAGTATTGSTSTVVTTTSTHQPGFGVVAALLAFLASVLLARRR